jgi:predicted CxxxxCH...CXXCH cytochrome family protein
VDLSQVPAFYTYTANRSTAGGYNFGCSNCHPLISTSDHAKGTIVLDFRPSVAGVGALRQKNSTNITVSGPAGTANGGTTADSATNSVVRCLNVYCHSNGFATNQVYATTPNWYGGTFSGDRCANCHGNSPNSTIAGSPAHYSTNFMGQGVTDGHVVGIHPDTIFTGTAGLATAGTSNVSGHGNATTATTINCNICHYATVTITNNDKNVACAACHNGTQAALRGDSGINNKSVHVNGIADVSFNPIKVRSKAQMLNSAVISPYSTIWTRNNGYKGAGSYDEAKTALDTATMWDSATKTCSNVSCHNNQPVKWGSTNGATSCQRCHPNM